MPLSDLNILVVDNDFENRGLIERYLIAYGAQVTGCSDGKSASTIRQKQNFNCIISDINVLNEDSSEFVKEIRQAQQAETPLIVTSTEDTCAIEESQARAAQGFLQKPFSLPSLKNLILATQ